MEEKKKLDLNTIIGFGLIFIIIVWMMMNNQKDSQKEQIEKAKATKDSILNAKAETPKQTVTTAVLDSTTNDSAAIKKLQGSLGSFAYSATLPSAKENFTTLENEFVSLKIANKGGYIVEAILKKYEKFKKNSGQLVELIKDNNASFNLQLQTKDNRVLNTKDLFFEPTLTKVGANQILSMKLKSGANEYLEYKYVLSANNYLVDFDIHSQGLNTVLNTGKPIDLEWDLKSYRNEKSIAYENRYSEIYFDHNDGKINYVGQGKDKEESPEKTTFIAYKQHFFSSILLTKTPFATTKLYSDNLVNDQKKDTIFTKQYKSTVPLAFTNGELDYKMNWYFGPTDYKTLKRI